MNSCNSAAVSNESVALAQDSTLYAEALYSCQKFEPRGPERSSGGARTAMKQNTSALHAVLYLHQDAIPELFEA